MDNSFDVTDLPLLKTWAEWGKVFTDLDVWEPAVREICRRAGLPVRTITAGYPGTNAVFTVNARRPDAAVVKIYAPLCAEDYDLERVLHPLLGRWPAIGVPALMAEGSLGADGAWPYIVLSFVHGEPIREVREELADRDLLDIANDLGHRLHTLHAIPAAAWGPLAAMVDEWPSIGRRYLEQNLDKLRSRKALPRTLLDAIPGLVNPFLEADTDLVLVSGDITEDHVLLAEDQGRWLISGLIDFADALIAPRAYEWVALWFSALRRDSVAFRAFLEGYGRGLVADASFHRTAMAFTFLHEFGAEIITDELCGEDLAAIRTLQTLQSILWSPD
jgi:Ser/Thr protein kinase RdoA (MazF antagonist)